MDRVDLSALFLHSLALWFVAVGGPSTILPDFHRYVVEAHHLMTSTEFAELYTLAQAAPGPNFMYATLMGWHLAGWAGAATMTIPVLVPATTLSLLVGHMNERYPNAPIGRAIRRGMAPIAIGLTFASATILMRSGQSRLARVLAHVGDRSAGPAHVMEPAVAARRRRTRRRVGSRAEQAFSL